MSKDGSIWQLFVLGQMLRNCHSVPEKDSLNKDFRQDVPGTSGTQTRYPRQKRYVRRLFLCFRLGVAGMSRDLGRDLSGFGWVQA